MPASFIPAQHPQRAERDPAAGRANPLNESKRKGFVVRLIDKPASIGLLPGFDRAHRLGHARVGHSGGGPEAFERAENVIAVAWRKFEIQERRINDFAGRQSPDAGALRNDRRR